MNTQEKMSLSELVRSAMSVVKELGSAALVEDNLPRAIQAALLLSETFQDIATGLIAKLAQEDGVAVMCGCENCAPGLIEKLKAATSSVESDAKSN